MRARTPFTRREAVRGAARGAAHPRACPVDAARPVADPNTRVRASRPSPGPWCGRWDHTWGYRRSVVPRRGGPRRAEVAAGLGRPEAVGRCGGRGRGRLVTFWSVERAEDGALHFPTASSTVVELAAVMHSTVRISKTSSGGNIRHLRWKDLGDVWYQASRDVEASAISRSTNGVTLPKPTERTSQVREARKQKFSNAIETYQKLQIRFGEACGSV